MLASGGANNSAAHSNVDWMLKNMLQMGQLSLRNTRAGRDDSAMGKTYGFIGFVWTGQRTSHSGRGVIRSGPMRR